LHNTHAATTCTKQPPSGLASVVTVKGVGNATAQNSYNDKKKGKVSCSAETVTINICC
jgi:hypothetical protein